VSKSHWRHAQGVLTFGAKPLLAGILNVTPDSFSDGGSLPTVDHALRRAEDLLNAGAHLIDLGGESTRPGATAVSVDEELRRVIPVINAMHRRWPLTVISIDTCKAEVARQAIEAGASIINDVGGGRWDENMLTVVTTSGAGYIATHSLDRHHRQTIPADANPAVIVSDFLRNLSGRLIQLGVDPQRIIYDPGVGFGKTAEQNRQLLHAAPVWSGLERPLMWGISRKRFLAPDCLPADREPAARQIYRHLLTQEYPQIWRVHDVSASARSIATHPASC
jgi:dihydropteroate synthase